jgi:hypothetical protein
MSAVPTALFVSHSGRNTEFLEDFVRFLLGSDSRFRRFFNIMCRDCKLPTKLVKIYLLLLFSVQDTVVNTCKNCVQPTAQGDRRVSFSNSSVIV